RAEDSAVRSRNANRPCRVHVDDTAVATAARGGANLEAPRHRDLTRRVYRNIPAVTGEDTLRCNFPIGGPVPRQGQVARLDDDVAGASKGEAVGRDLCAAPHGEFLTRVDSDRSTVSKGQSRIDRCIRIARVEKALRGQPGEGLVSIL